MLGKLIKQFFRKTLKLSPAEIGFYDEKEFVKEKNFHFNQKNDDGMCEGKSKNGEN